MDVPGFSTLKSEDFELTDFSKPFPSECFSLVFSFFAFTVQFMHVHSPGVHVTIPYVQRPLKGVKAIQ